MESAGGSRNFTVDVSRDEVIRAIGSSGSCKDEPVMCLWLTGLPYFVSVVIDVGLSEKTTPLAKMSTDVRTLLRTELATRRITHPYATYSPNGVLICSLCKLVLKSHSLWDAHLRSPQHLTRVSSVGQVEEQNSNGGGRKRKADDYEDDEGTDHDGDVNVDGAGENEPARRRRRKKEVHDDGRSSVPDGFFDEEEDGREGGLDARQEPSQTQQPQTSPAAIPSAAALPADFFDDVNNSNTTGTIKLTPTPDINESEWAAFEADIALVTPKPSTSVLTAPSTISAPAMSAADLLSANRDDAPAVKEAEMEAAAEKEDAARRLEEEFEEMEGLEERVRRLREKRERLRSKTIIITTTADAVEVEKVGSEPRTADGDGDGDVKISGNNDEVESESDVDEWDDWRFRAR